MNTKKTAIILFCLTFVSGVVYLTSLKKSANDIEFAPEFTTKVNKQEIVYSTNGMVVTANPYASEAAMEMLCKGGTALDAAVAAQMMLTLVEPQSSGIGGGAFVLYYDKKSGKVYAYDGRETTPAKFNERAFYDEKGNPKSLFDVYSGGLTVGVPGVLKMLEMAHEKHGKLPWESLFSPAIRSATKGFKVSSRLHAHLTTNDRLKKNQGARQLYFNAAGKPVQEAQMMKNPELADTLQLIASQGTTPFYKGIIAQDIVTAVANSAENRGQMELSDLENYEALERKPVSLTYRDYQVISIPPPSSGGVAILEMLGILNFFELNKNPMYSLETIHLIASASNIAFADRDEYLADPDFEAVPISSLLDPVYLEKRAKEIPLDKFAGKASPGKFPVERWRVGESKEVTSTTQISIVDAEGNAVSMTSSIEQAFGSGVLVRGFFLNNHLTDFTFDHLGMRRKEANRILPGKRPRSSMSPTFVFDQKSGTLCYVIGSPGGSRIISYVSKALIGLIDYDFDIQKAISSPNFSSRNGPLELEQDTTITNLQPQLKKMGYTVKIIDLNSGMQGIQVIRGGRLSGGADPRRDSLAIGGEWCGE